MDKEVYEVRLANWKQLNLQCHDIVNGRSPVLGKKSERIFLRSFFF